MSEFDKVFAALAKAQSALSAPSKNREVTVTMKTGGKYKFKYATLDHLIEHIRKPFTDNGLWFVQRTEPGAMVTRIVHESGQWCDSAVPMPNLPNAPQEAGSVLTYFRRYSLAVAAGLASDEDDDANVAEGNGYEPRQRQQEPAEPFPPGPTKGITEMKAKARELWREIEGCGDTNELNALLDTKDCKALLKQMSELENPNHREIWEGDGKDNPGIAGLITRKETEFAMHIADVARA